MKLCILKIGGSVATVKSSATPKIRRTLLAKIFGNLKIILERDPALQLIVIHGAGTFGHTLAHKYRLREGTGAHKDGKIGAVKTRHAVQTLTTQILSLGIDAGLPMTTLHTGTFCMQKGKKLTYDREVLMHALREKYIPLLSGDMVFDTELGMSVCSGDTIAAELARALLVEKLFFASDVDGIFTADPYTTKNAELVPLFFVENGTLPHITLSGSHNLDVTGGLKGKIAECEKLFKNSTLHEIHIFNGLKTETYAKALTGKKFPHTIIERVPDKGLSQ